MPLNYRIEGEGAPLVLLHGLGVTFAIWKDLAPLLRPHYKLIMVELPGHGQSAAVNGNYYEASAEQLEKLRQELGIDRWGLLGYSMGAWVGQIYANRYPQHVREALFLCPARVRKLWGWSLRGIKRFDRIMPKASNWLLKGWRLNRLVRLFGFNGRSDPYSDLWAHEIESQSVDTIKSLLRDLPEGGCASFSIPNSIPTLIIWGEQDVITAHPRRVHSGQALIRGNHSAPMRSAQQTAKAILTLPRGREFTVAETRLFYRFLKKSTSSSDK